MDSGGSDSQTGSGLPVGKFRRFTTRILFREFFRSLPNSSSIISALDCIKMLDEAAGTSLGGARHALSSGWTRTLESSYLNFWLVLIFLAFLDQLVNQGHNCALFPPI